MGARSIRPAAGHGDGAGWSPGDRPDDDRRRAFGTRCKGSDFDHSRYLYGRRRSSRNGTCRKLQSPWGECDRGQFVNQPGGTKASRTAARAAAPHATIIGFLLNPNLPQSERQVSDVQDAARAMSLQVHILRPSTDREIDSAFEAVGAHSIQALAVSADPFLDTRREKLVSLAAHRA